MKRSAFIEKNQGDWDRLGATVRGVSKKDLVRLDEAQIDDLSRGYRKVLCDLAYARTHIPDPDLISYLNSLAVRAHSLIFGSSPVDPSGLGRFLSATFPDAVRGAWRYLAIATGVFITAAAFAFVAVHFEMRSGYRLLPSVVTASMHVPDFGSSTNPMSAPLLSSTVTTNNIRVAFLALGAGFTFGLGTVLVLWYNGLVIGGLAAAAARAGNSVPFWATIMPHGSIELPAILISGAAGLIIGHALLLPRRATRAASLRRTAPTVFKLIGGVVFCLVIAGAIEGFLSPKPFPNAVKLAFSSVASALLAVYLGGFPRRRRKVPAEPGKPPRSG